jgi:hypothetical protein
LRPEGVTTSSSRLGSGLKGLTVVSNELRGARYNVRRVPVVVGICAEQNDTPACCRDARYGLYRPQIGIGGLVTAPPPGRPTLVPSAHQTW